MNTIINNDHTHIIKYYQVYQTQCQHCLKIYSKLDEDFDSLKKSACINCGSTEYRIINKNLVVSCNKSKEPVKNEDEKLSNNTVEFNKNYKTEKITKTAIEKTYYGLPPMNRVFSESLLEIQIPILLNYEKIFLLLTLICLVAFYLYSQVSFNLVNSQLINIILLSLSGIFGIILSDKLVEKIDNKLRLNWEKNVKNNYIAKNILLSNYGITKIYDIISENYHLAIVLIPIYLFNVNPSQLQHVPHIQVVYIVVFVALIFLILYLIFIIPSIILSENQTLKTFLKYIRIVFFPFSTLLNLLDRLIKLLLLILTNIILCPIYVLISYREFVKSIILSVGILLAKLNKKFSIAAVHISLLQVVRIFLLLLCSLGMAINVVRV